MLHIISNAVRISVSIFAIAYIAKLWSDRKEK